MERILDEFEDIGVNLNADWLAGLELLNEETLTNDEVYLALVSSDVRESCVTPATSPLRPESLVGKSRFPRGSFFFQVTDVVDISLPDMQRPRTSGSNSKRMLKLTLHSGPDTVLHAIELEPIPDFPDSLCAGSKLIIAGSPLLSEGLILLRPENIKLVGGDVSQLSSQQQTALRNRMSSRDPLTYKAGARPINSR